MALSLAACGSTATASSAAESTSTAASSEAASTDSTAADDGDVLQQAAAAAFANDVTLTMWGAEEDQELLRTIADNFIKEYGNYGGKITINRQDTCPDCGGTGAAKGTSPETCPDCGGRGYVVTQQRTPFGVMQSQQPCSHCGGRGTIIRNPCKTCRGTGKTAARKSLEINIPAGIDDDQNIALRGQGDAGSNGGPAGDVIVHVTVKADPMFERDGYDVTIHVPITFSQAVLGDDVEVPTVDGRIVQHIPEGTQSGTKFRLRGQGIQYLNGRGRGDQYVIVDVEIPKKVTRAQREALKAFEDSMKEDNYEKRKGFFKNLRDRFS